jgi:mannan endo-1,4-beta-mannosidase
MKRLLFTLTILSTFSLFATAQTKYEAEAAQRSNCDVVSGSKYSGGKAVKMTEDNATLSFTIPIDKRGKYNISMAGDGIGGGKVVNCTVNGSTTTFQLNTYEEVKLGTFILKEGNNTVVITPNWTWFDIDYLLIAPNENTLEFNIAEAPVDANANNASREMYGFL